MFFIKSTNCSSLTEDKFCTITYDKLYNKLSSHYGHMLQDTTDDMFKYMIQCITDSVNSKFNDANTATVCQVCSFVRLFVCLFYWRFWANFESISMV